VPFRQRVIPHLGRSSNTSAHNFLRFITDRRAAAALRQLFALLTKTSLDRLHGPPCEGLSFINAIGPSFQWFEPGGFLDPMARFLCEVRSAPAPHPAARFAQTRDVIEDPAALAAPQS